MKVVPVSYRNTGAGNVSNIRNGFLKAGTPELCAVVTGESQVKCGRGLRAGEHRTDSISKGVDVRNSVSSGSYKQ